MNKFITIINFNRMNKVIRTYILKNKLIIGKCDSTIHNNIGYINSINIIPKFRKQRLGDKLLKKTEEVIIENFKVSSINILVWNKMNTDLINFYIKNNYKVIENNNIYDDGEYIYDLINVKKIV